MAVKHFIQHIGGDPIALRFVKHDTMRERADKTWECEWTDDPEERAEWFEGREAHAARDLLGVGVVLHTQPEPIDADAEAKIADRRAPREPDIPRNEPIADKDLPWWQR